MSSADEYPPLPTRSHYDPVYSYPNSMAGSTDQFPSQPHQGAHLGGQPYSHDAPSGSTAFLNEGTDSARGYGEKYTDGHEGDSGPPVSMLRGSGYGSNGGKKGMLRGKRRKWAIIAAIILLLVIIAGVAGGVAASKKSKDADSSDAQSNLADGKKGGDEASDKGNGAASVGNSASNSADAIRNSAITGGNGTLITTETGENFTYINNFGGYWVSTPFDDSARPQSWTKPLNESWDFTNDKIYGVNIGGWLVTEPFIVPGLFEPFENDTNPAVDEYTLMASLGTDAVAKMTEHYDTFITEEDFALIAGAGLNWVRLSLPHWAIETIEGEPFIEGLQWKYALKALTWARKYGLRVNLDLHTMPGSQNGWNHSGKLGSIGFLNGTAGLFNAQRGLNFVRTLAEFAAQPEYMNLIQMFSFINEPNVGTITDQVMRQFYLEAYTIIRDITGTGDGKGPYVSFHDGFVGLPAWSGFLAGADRIAMDQHNYLGFSDPSNDSVGYQAGKPCSYWAPHYNQSMIDFGFSYSGEWSLAINDCGIYLNNVGNGARFDGTYIAPGRTTPTYQAVGNCDDWNDYTKWDATTKTGLMDVALASMDATQNWFFWTWKIGTSQKFGGLAPNPMWNMKLALTEGFFPLDPREHPGTCNRIIAQQGFAPLPTNMTFTAFPSPWMTGGAGAGTIVAAQTQAYGQWPPTSIRDIPSATNLPQYTQTGSVITMPPSTPLAYPTAATNTIAPGNGWANTADTAQWYTAMAGCTYPAPYEGVNEPVPTAPCSPPASEQAQATPTARS